MTTKSRTRHAILLSRPQDGREHLSVCRSFPANNRFLDTITGIVVIAVHYIHLNILCYLKNAPNKYKVYFYNNLDVSVAGDVVISLYIVTSFLCKES